MLLLVILILLMMPSGVISQSNAGVVINEILFNPPRDGYDYVELYNHGPAAVNLQQIVIANRNSTGDIASAKPLTRVPVWLPPQKFTLITANEKWLRQNYQVSGDVIVCQLSSLPSFPDDNGSAILLHVPDSIILDELNYDEKWHFALVDDPSGVALEKIHPGLTTNDRQHWTSASSASGYGTPGYQNSQYRSSETGAAGIVSVAPNVITPDNDGRDDYAQLTVTLSEPGYVGNVCLYDANGRKVTTVLRNRLLGIENRFRWDGLTDSGQKISAGIYILYTEIFNLYGKVKKFKNVIVIGYRSD